MAEQVKVPASKLDDLSLIFRTHMVGGRRELIPASCFLIYTHTHTTHTMHPYIDTTTKSPTCLRPERAPALVIVIHVKGFNSSKECLRVIPELN